jgi:hypothetical protein
MRKSNELYLEYAMQSLDFSDYTDKKIQKKARVRMFFNECYRVNGHEMKRKGMTEQEMAGDFLRGLPSFVNIEFSNYDIERRMYKWRVLKKNDTDAKKSKLIAGYWDYIALMFLRLRKQYNLDSEFYPQLMDLLK